MCYKILNIILQNLVGFDLNIMQRLNWAFHTKILFPCGACSLFFIFWFSFKTTFMLAYSNLFAFIKVNSYLGTNSSIFLNPQGKINITFSANLHVFFQLFSLTPQTPLDSVLILLLKRMLLEMFVFFFCFVAVVVFFFCYFVFTFLTCLSSKNLNFRFPPERKKERQHKSWKWK